jgi:hypothetical protein
VSAWQYKKIPLNEAPQRRDDIESSPGTAAGILALQTFATSPGRVAWAQARLVMALGALEQEATALGPHGLAAAAGATERSHRSDINGVMRRTATRRFARSAPGVLILRYCSP